MKHTNQSQANSSYFQNLDAISGMKELSDEAAAICSGGQNYRWGDLISIKDQDKDGSDEVYITLNGQKIWGSEVKKGEIKNLRSLPSLKTGDKIQVFDKDYFSPNDRIGSFIVGTVNSPVPLTESGANYKLTYANA